MGQRGLLDRLSVAHTASVTTLDWRNLSSGGIIASPVSPSAGADGVGNGIGWLASGGLDRCVKVWDLTAPSANARIPNKATYVLHPYFPVRRVVWRPSYECELAVVSNAEFSVGSNSDILQTAPASPRVVVNEIGQIDITHATRADPVEIWDVRRGWIAKWQVMGSAAEGGATSRYFLILYPRCCRD